jgi:hypothetical protein
MNFGTWLLIISLAAIVVLFMLLRPRAGSRKYPEIIQFILYDIKMNQALVETFPKRDKPKTFESNNWEVNKTKIGFLTETQKDLLKETFALADELNIVIKAAKRDRSDLSSYKNLDLTKFKELLDRCQKELEDWMVTTTGQKEMPLKYPSILSILFGERP